MTLATRKRRLDPFLLSCVAIGLASIAATASLRFIAGPYVIRYVHAIVLLGFIAVYVGFVVKRIIDTTQIETAVRPARPNSPSRTLERNFAIGLTTFLAAIAAVATVAGLAFATLPDRFVQLVSAAGVGVPMFAILLGRRDSKLLYGDAVPTASSLRRSLALVGMQWVFTAILVLNGCLNGADSDFAEACFDTIVALSVYAATATAVIFRRILDALPADADADG